MANDIRTVSDPDAVTSLTAQVIGKTFVKTNRNQTKELGGLSSTQNDERSDIDPNNIVDKYDDRIDMVA